ncbi:ATP-binding protein [Spirulina sp. CS-785/01]|uniref:ATP-binding protein n=1 Tax=Spirulina sp. CS-785/01 TaxID=3021716 RepID=UPI00232B1B7E|nr:ATP-binding protein [Spirulina sp. CS-785/01]MDB9312304.1 ATP-binding protein [Spirulina sp. CS-785/01]
MEGLTVAGRWSALQEVAQYIKTVTEQAGLDRESAYRLRLAVDEMTTNIILHGYQEAGLEGNIVLQARLNPQSLTILIEDTGRSYDPQSVHEAEAKMVNLPLEKRPMGGLGVYLALNSVDDFQYQCLRDRNRSIFTMYRPTP